MKVDEAAKQQARSAAALLAEVPEVIDVSAWFEQHTALLHQLLHHAVSVVASSSSRHDKRLLEQLGQTHADLHAHTLKIAGPAVPKVLSRDGKHPIPFQRLAEARAKVQVLTNELAELEALESWQPRFDVMSPKQEALAIQFCAEIAGRVGEAGSPPDPVRLLEMAEALYQAEREEMAP
ncbi:MULTISPECIES: phosphotransferase [unclassified Acidovorax]|uniref:phosphotransferase n=1 Tax=unclassified Acidovorax TaxID=2684926 RepID=UPI002883002B|nr:MULTISPECIES: phosphotransferase [unclassified Acidovorax]